MTNNSGDAELLPMSWRRLDAEALGLAAMKMATRYASLMIGGVVFPAIFIITGLDGRYWIVNGTHRYAASQICGFSWITTIIVPSSFVK